MKSAVESNAVVQAETDGEIGILRLNRPDVHNVIDSAVIERWEAILDELDSNRTIRFLIVTASGNRSFCAGGDLKYFATLKSSSARLHMARRMRNILNRLFNRNRVVVAAVNGRAIGGGCEILLAAHFRIAATNATFAFVHASRGLVTAWHGGARLIRLVGQSRALELVLTGKTIRAPEARRIGLVDRIVPRPKVLSSAIAFCQTMASQSPMAIKGFLQITAQPTWASRKRSEESWLERCWVGPDFQRTLATLSTRKRIRAVNTTARAD